MVSKNRSKEVTFGQSSKRIDKYNHAANRTKVKTALLHCCSFVFFYLSTTEKMIRVTNSNHLGARCSST